MNGTENKKRMNVQEALTFLNLLNQEMENENFKREELAQKKHC